jgi:hypothetical protein
MRGLTDREKLDRFMAAIGREVRGGGVIYLTGGATALLHGWRASTVDVDIKADPEPPGLFEAIARLKEELDINVELASPDDFIPPLPEWRERSIPIARHGEVAFLHYDPYAQALSKLLRSHERDLSDLRDFLRYGLIEPRRLREMFEAIEPQLLRYPAIDAATFRGRVLEFCRDAERPS